MLFYLGSVHVVFQGYMWSLWSYQKHAAHSRPVIILIQAFRFRNSPRVLGQQASCLQHVYGSSLFLASLLIWSGQRNQIICLFYLGSVHDVFQGYMWSLWCYHTARSSPVDILICSSRLRNSPRVLGQALCLQHVYGSSFLLALLV